MGAVKRIGAAMAVIWATAGAQAAPLDVVAAENVYGDVARQVGGDHVAVSSILSRSDQDPHLFEPGPAAARQTAGARLVVYNGAAYDAWMEKLLAASKGQNRRTIEVAALVGAKAGDNPHVWYDVAAIKALAARIAADLAELDPAHAADYRAGAERFLASLRPLDARIAAMKARYAGAAVTATEPVFSPMARALGLVMRNERFQLAIQNDAEPSASDVAAFEDDLKYGRVRVLIYNVQADEPAARRLVDLARDKGAPTVGVSETEPAGQDYQAWMMTQLDALDAALAARSQSGQAK